MTVRSNPWLVGLTSLSLVAPLGGCSILTKAASGGTLTVNDLVNEADRTYQKHEQKQRQVADLEKRIDEELKDIADLRQRGQFSSAGYNEKSLTRLLEDLRELDARSPKLAAAPAELERIKSTYTEEVYKKKALTEECAQAAENAKKSRLDEQWSSVDQQLERYVRCRRHLRDAGGDSSAQDRAVISELDAFIEHAIQTSEQSRQEQRFYQAVGIEKNVEDKLADYAELAPGSSAPQRLRARMDEVRKTYRDPEEIAAEQARDAFEAWRANAAELFSKEWIVITAAETAARPHYDAGLAALEQRDYATALKNLMEARKTLFQTAYPSPVALETAVANGSLTRGLSYEISAALARLHFEEGRVADLYPELSLIKKGRAWLGQNEELAVRLYDILADTQGRLAPKTTDLVKRYASQYSQEAKNLRLAKEKADAASGEAYNMLGVDLSTVSHSEAASEPAANVGKVVFIEEPVSAVEGNKLRFEFLNSYEVPNKCWNTGRVSSVNIWTGAVYYEEKCTYKTVQDGYVLVVPAPVGVKVRKGDVVSFYATIGKKGSGLDLRLENPAYVRIAPGGATAWYLGAGIARQ